MKELLFTLLIISLSVWLPAQNYAPGVLLAHFVTDACAQEFVKDYKAIGPSNTSLSIERPICTRLNIWRLQFDHQSIALADLQLRLQADVRVLAVQPDHYVSSRTNVPNDPLLPQQWSLNNIEFPGADVRALPAWDICTGGVTVMGDTVVIAMIDDGIDIHHPDLKANLWVNNSEIPNNGIDDDGNGYIDDYKGWNVSAGMDMIQYGIHGTQVAGVLAASGNNNQGIASLNWNIKLMTVTGVGNLESQILEGYVYILNQRLRHQASNGQEGAFVVAINTSWGIDAGQASSAPIWCNFYETLGQAGILSVAAVANKNWNIDTQGDLPGTCPSPYLITTTATNKYDQRGQAAWGPQHVDLGAPGIDVLSTKTGGGYGQVSGTSFAAPLVSSLIGLLYAAPCEYLPALAKASPAEAAAWVREILLSSVDVLPGLQQEILSGGRINAHQAILALTNQCQGCFLPAALQASSSNNAVLLSWQDLGSNPSLELQWRETGQNSWQSVLLPSSPYQLHNLPDCIPHEFRLGIWCAATNSMQYTTSKWFFSYGCCQPPASIQVSAHTETSLRVCWQTASDSEPGYLLRYRPIGQTLWHATLACNVSEILIEELTPCTWYEFQIAQNCSNQPEIFSSVQVAQTLGCGTCTDADYCGSGAQSAQYEWIQSVELNNSKISSGSDGGYGNHTGQVYTLHPDSLHHLIVIPGFSFSPYSQHYRVWIDSNQDGIFQHPEELILDSDAAILTPFDARFFLPETVRTGTTRMRISMKWTDANVQPPLPCENYYFGETEDFCVFIPLAEPLPCPIAPTPTISWTGSREAWVLWETDQSVQNAQVRYRKAGFIPWNYLPSVRSPLLVDQLDPCETYEIQLQYLCAERSSEFSKSVFTQTECPDQRTHLSPESTFSCQLQPNPWSNGSLRLQINSTEAKSIQIRWLSASGVQVHQEASSVRPGNSTILLEIPQTYSSGLYFIQIIESERKMQTLRLVIAR